MTVAILLELLYATSGCLILSRNLGSGLVTDGRKLDGSLRVASGRLRRVGGILGISRTSSSASALLLCLALVLFLLLACLPFFSDLLELCFKT